jgi:hypothetical protein
MPLAGKSIIPEQKKEKQDTAYEGDKHHQSNLRKKYVLFFLLHPRPPIPDNN